MDVKNLDLREKLGLATQLFNAFSRKREIEGNHIHSTGKGVYLASNMAVCAGVMVYLAELDEGKTEGKVFVDAGSGSGEAVAIANLFGYYAGGIEWDANRVMEANLALYMCQRKGILQGNSRTVQGNFMDNGAYDKLGTPFKTVDYFFHAMNTPDIDGLLQKVSNDAKTSARVVLLGGEGLRQVVKDYQVGSLVLKGVETLPIEAVFSTFALYDKAN